MTRKIIDMTKDPRGGQFEYFRTMTDPWAGITVPMDITALLASLNGRPFFLDETKEPFLGGFSSAISMR